MMKIVLIVYGISWFILLAFSFIADLRGGKAPKESWYFYAFIAIIAPLVVVYSLFYLVQLSIEKIMDEMWNKKEAKENAYKQRALQEMEAAMGKPQNDNPLVHALTARALLEAVENKDYDSFMQHLSHLSLPAGTTLHVEQYRRIGHDDESKPFVEGPKGAKDQNIWKHIKAEKSIDGAWEAYLLSKVWHVLPLWWHSNYSSRIYLYSKDDADHIIPLTLWNGEFVYENEEEKEKGELERKREKEREKEKFALIRKEVRPLIGDPEVLEAEGKFFVRCCYWTYLGGLIKESVEVIITSKGKVSFKDIGQDKLYGYECGIRF